jgi:hypothetical protein
MPSLGGWKFGLLMVSENKNLTVLRKDDKAFRDDVEKVGVFFFHLFS